MRKQQKIRKQIVLDPDVHELLISLSEQTNYNHSEIIEIAIKKLDLNIKNEDIKAFNEIIENTINLLSTKLVKKAI